MFHDEARSTVRVNPHLKCYVYYAFFGSMAPLKESKTLTCTAPRHLTYSRLDIHTRRGGR